MILWKVKIRSCPSTNIHKLDVQMSAAEDYTDYTAVKGGKLSWQMAHGVVFSDGLRMALWGELVPHGHDICISCEHEAHPGAQFVAEGVARRSFV